MSICRLLLITFCAASAVANAVAAELVLRDFAAPRGAVVRLGDVADLMVTNSASSTGNGAAGLLDTPLMPSPAPGTKQFLRLAELRDVLAGRGVDVRAMTFSGAEVVTISSFQPDSPNNDPDSASGNTRPPLDNQDRVELLTNAITEYLRTQTNHELWRVQVELEPEVATLLDKARSSFSVAGGKAPWSGRQRFEITAESGRSRARVYARIDRLHTAVFAVRQIVKGDLVRRGDVELRSHVGALPVQATDSLDAVVGKEAIQGIRADSMIVIVVWVWNTVADYLLVPLERGAQRLLLSYYEDEIRPADTPHGQVVDGVTLIEGRTFRQTGDGRFVPAEHYDEVVNYVGAANVPGPAIEVYRLWVQRTFLQRHIVVPVFLSVFILVLYLLGKFLAAGMGRFFWTQFERFITRLPLIRNVYSSVKQVTDFMFTERELEYTRIVAIEYPRMGMWSLAFVTGESIHDIACAANEPVVAVLVPTSPMPFTGFTCTVKKSEIIDLSITMEQALQFIVSCGVVAPPQEFTQAVAKRLQQPPLPSPTD